MRFDDAGDQVAVVVNIVGRTQRDVDETRSSLLTVRDGRVVGCITFAGVAALVAGAYNALSGIAALSVDDTLAAQAQEVLYGIAAALSSARGRAG